MPNTVYDVYQTQADTAAKQLANQKAVRELPYTEQSLVSEIMAKQAYTNRLNAETERDRAMLNIDKAMAQQDLQDKTTAAEELMSNRQFRDMSNKVKFMEDSVKVKMAVENPEEFQKLVTSVDRVNSAQAAEIEYGLKLDQQYGMYGEMYNLINTAQQNGTLDRAAQYLPQIAKKYGQEMPEFMAQGVNSNSLIQVKQAMEGVLYDRTIAQEMAKSKISQVGTMEERLISELPPEMQSFAKARLLENILNKGSNGTEFERGLQTAINQGSISPEEAEKLLLQKLKREASGKSSRITISPNASGGFEFNMEEGGDLGENPITSNKRDDLVSQKDFIEQGEQMIDQVLSNTQMLGSVASIAGAIRTGTEVTKDLFTTFPGAASVVESATNMIGTIVDPKDIGEVNQMFDSEMLDQLSIFENSIGLLLARTRVPDNRIPVEVIRQSIKDVRLRGLKGNEQVRNRLNNVKNQLSDARKRLEDRILGERGVVVIEFDSNGNRIK